MGGGGGGVLDFGGVPFELICLVCVQYLYSQIMKKKRVIVYFLWFSIGIC